MPLRRAAQKFLLNPWVTACITLGLFFYLIACSPRTIDPISQVPSDAPSNSILPSPSPRRTSTPTFLPSPTPSPTHRVETQAKPARTEAPGVAEPQITPFVPIRGNADKIAFIDRNEIWISNIDGKALTQLTRDGSPKSNPGWSHQANQLIYLSGICAKTINIQTFEISELACFDGAKRLYAFEPSPDGELVAVSLDRQLYIVPLDINGLNQAKSGADLSDLADCETLSPYKHRQSVVTVSDVKWSAFGDRLAIVRQGFESGRQVELIHILDISSCTSPLPRLDEFPATRFEMADYAKNPFIQNFGWDGDQLFALTSYKRNDGFGDLWIYNSDLKRAFLANPIGGKCCYRDPVFSPDGKYIAFVFQDTQNQPNGPASLYYIPYEALDTSLIYPPLPIPTQFFSDTRTKPEPALRLAP
jgi:Tol biopolymer transport system component